MISESEKRGHTVFPSELRRMESSNFKPNTTYEGYKDSPYGKYQAMMEAHKNKKQEGETNEITN